MEKMLASSPMIAARSATDGARVSGALERRNIEQIVNEHYTRLQSSFSNNTDDWKRDIPGRVVLNVLAAKAKIQVARLKTLYLRQASKVGQNRFAEVIEVFDHFSRSQ